MKFYNTIGLNKEQFDKEVRNATKQEEIILSLFKNSKQRYLTPTDIFRALDKKYPITSIRRAITNLTPDKLVKTCYQREGLYGKPNYCWVLKERENVG